MTKPGTNNASLVARTGDALHVLNITSIAVYFCAVWRDSPVLDAAWQREGFCLPATDVPYATTHDYAGYVLIASTILFLTLMQFSSVAGVATRSLSTAYNLAYWALIGALAHGVGHLIIADAKRRNMFPSGHQRGYDGILKQFHQHGVVHAIGHVMLFYILFWIPLVRTYMMHASLQYIGVVATLVHVGSLPFPLQYGFAYTQSVLFAGMSVDQILHATDKGWQYALWPLMTVLPSTALSWWEATACSSNGLLQNLGHVWYDVFMVASYMFYYGVCYVVHRQRQAATLKVE